MDEPTPSGPPVVFQGLKAGHDYRYMPAQGEGYTLRRGEACTMRRVLQDDPDQPPEIIVEFADGEQLAVAWTALRSMRERVRGS